MNVYEVNFDGLVGQTHHYGGLSPGNLASQQHSLQVSHPRAAALQGLEKMKLLMDLGLKQAVLPPHERPHLGFLRQQGFAGSDRQVIQQAAASRPDLLSIASSSAFMWAANAATVSPSMDTSDGKVHITPANLISTPHRSLECEFTSHLMQWIFANSHFFTVHEPLAADPRLADEGAANHTRLCPAHGQPGIELFTYGRVEGDPRAPAPRHFPARQTNQASSTIAAGHLMSSEALLVQQNPDAIDAGVFHNDVICVGNENVLLLHEQAFVNQPAVLTKIHEQFPGELHVIEISADEFTLEEAVSTYLFNSQLLTLADGAMLLLCPIECQTHVRAKRVIDRILAGDNPVSQVRFVDVRQSMRNGGGPACLRLRVVLTEQELSGLQGSFLLTDARYEQLRAWICRHYREHLSPGDLADPKLMDEVRTALDELTGILDLRCRYPFQRNSGSSAHAEHPAARRHNKRF